VGTSKAVYFSIRLLNSLANHRAPLPPAQATMQHSLSLLYLELLHVRTFHEFISISMFCYLGPLISACPFIDIDIPFLQLFKLSLLHNEHHSLMRHFQLFFNLRDSTTSR
jgi:hypothetical protein